MIYRADVDGLRSIAIIPVVLFHLGFSWISGGYFGVDVFFVISGFLITSILFKEIETHSFSMIKFWLRRVKRILPAIITVILTTLLVAPFLIFKGDIISLTSDSLSALFSYANFHMLSKFGDYWGKSAENSFFLHAWSLSVEEQFYVFYPLFLFSLYKLKQSLLKWLFVVIGLSLGVFLLGSVYYPTLTFYLLPTRAWELAAGGLLGVLNGKKSKIDSIPKNLKSIIPIIGLGLIFCSYFVFTGNENINSFAVLPVFGTVLIIAFSSGNNLMGKFLSVKPLVYVGKISYSLYLWHWPIIVLFRTYYWNKFPLWQIQLIVVVLTTIFSILSYHLIENRTRKWEHTPKLVLGSVIVVLGLTFLLKSPIIKKEYDSPFNKTVFYGLYYDITPTILEVSDVNKAKRKNILIPLRDEKYKEAYKSGGIVTSNIAGNPQVVVLGDSHGAMWAKTIDEIAVNNQIKVSSYTSVGVSPFFNVNDIENQQSSRGFSREQRVAYAKDLTANLKTRKPRLLIIACKWNSINEDEFKNLEDLVQLAQKSGTKILILNQPPQIETLGDKNSAQYFTFLGYKTTKGNQYIQSESDVAESNKTLKNRFAKYTNVIFFDVYKNFVQPFKQTNFLIINNNNVLYYDDDHLSYQGTTFLKSELEKVICEIIE